LKKLFCKNKLVFDRKVRNCGSNLITMSKQVIQTNKVPAPIGPYSQAVIANGFLFASGQIAFDPTTGELVLDTIQSETKQVMENIKAILEAANIHFGHIVKTTIFLSDMQLFAQVNEVYGSYFADQFPARETVAVKTLPRNVNVEISVTAVIAL
jgi:2-iminobutanoate/2-iminopropanoate deaminase